MSSSLIDTYSISSLEGNSILLSHVRRIVKFYIWPLLVLFGLTGNLISILVLTRRRLIRTSTNNYLTVLAIFDSCYLIFTLLLNFGSHPKFIQYKLIGILLDILRPLADFSSNTATWLIICFTVERTLAIAKPIYAKRTCSVRRSRRVICTLLILCFLITIPTFFEKNLISKNDINEFDKNFTKIQNFTKQEELFIDLHRLYLVFICIVIIWIPLILLCVCNSILIWYVHRSRHFDDDTQSAHIYESTTNSSNSINRSEYSIYNYRQSSLVSTLSTTSSNPYYLRRHRRSINQKRRVTIILIFCLFVALFLWTPQSLSLTYETLIENFSEMSNQDRIKLLIFNNFANLFVCINASTDLILYCFLSEKFARTCKQIFCRQCSNNITTNSQQQHRLLSIDRTSILLANPTNNIHQQQLAANRTNRYYIQLYNLYRNSSGYKIKSNKKWKKKFVRSITTNTKTDKFVFYHKSLTQNRQSLPSAANIRLNPILDYIDENNENSQNT